MLTYKRTDNTTHDRRSNLIFTRRIFSLLARPLWRHKHLRYTRQNVLRSIARQWQVAEVQAVLLNC